MSKRTKLIIGVLVAMAMIAVSSVAPALAEGGKGCGIGTILSSLTSTAGKSGNGELNGAFSKDAAQNSDPTFRNFGQKISDPTTGATNCAQK